MEITDLRPKEIFHWFGKICSIPHGSENTAALSEFCVSFAAERGLKCLRDDAGNVIIFKDASPDKAGSEPVILQGHLDMVCDKLQGCTKDMQNEGVTPLTDGEFIFADGTTLGADDGIAIAYILTILDSSELSHPPIEALFTVDEEIGLIGAEVLDCSPLKGRRLINIDSEEEGILTVGCAGGARIVCDLPLSLESCENTEKSFVKLSVSGLLGGHSGIDIDKHRANAVIILARMLYRIAASSRIAVCSLAGGAKMNIIPPNAEAVICCETPELQKILDTAAEFAADVKTECRVTEPNVRVTAQECEMLPTCTDTFSTEKLIFALMQSPHGVVAMSPDIQGMVQTSLNFGTAALDGEKLTVCYFVRSNEKCGKQPVADKLCSLYGFLGGTVTLSSDYPPWEYRPDSPLREIMAETYRELYGRDVGIMSIHAGLECGTLSAKLDNADMISIGPSMENVHTPNERLNVSSAARCYEYLIAVLKKL